LPCAPGRYHPGFSPRGFCDTSMSKLRDTPLILPVLGVVEKQRVGGFEPEDTGGTSAIRFARTPIALRPFEAFPSLVCARPRVTAVEVVVDEPHRLHERVCSGRADEPPPAAFQVLGECL